MLNPLGNTSNQPYKSRKIICGGINDNICTIYNSISEMKLKTTSRKSNLFDYRHAYIPVKRTITVAANIVAAASDVSNINITFKNCTPFTDFFTKINNTKANNAKDLHIAMLKYNLVKYIENSSTTCENL